MWSSYTLLMPVNVVVNLLNEDASQETAADLGTKRYLKFKDLKANIKIVSVRHKKKSVKKMQTSLHDRYTL